MKTIHTIPKAKTKRGQEFVIENYLLKDIKNFLSQKGLPASGNKKDLTKRLVSSLTLREMTDILDINNKAPPKNERQNAKLMKLLLTTKDTADYSSSSGRKGAIKSPAKKKIQSPQVKKAQSPSSRNTQSPGIVLESGQVIPDPLKMNAPPQVVIGATIETCSQLGEKDSKKLLKRLAKVYPEYIRKVVCPPERSSPRPDLFSNNGGTPYDFLYSGPNSRNASPYASPVKPTYAAPSPPRKQHSPSPSKFVFESPKKPLSGSPLARSPVRSPQPLVRSPKVQSPPRRVPPPPLPQDKPSKSPSPSRPKKTFNADDFKLAMKKLEKPCDQGYKRVGGVCVKEAGKSPVAEKRTMQEALIAKMGNIRRATGSPRSPASRNSNSEWIDEWYD